MFAPTLLLVALGSGPVDDNDKFVFKPDM